MGSKKKGGSKKGNGKAKQLRVPGTEHPDRNPAIEAAAEAYVEVRNERMGLTEREVQAQGKLLLEMEKAGLSTYRCDDQDYIVELSDTKKAKVRKIKEPAPEDAAA